MFERKGFGGPSYGTRNNIFRGITPQARKEKYGAKSLYEGEVLATTACTPLCVYGSMYNQRS